MLTTLVCRTQHLWLNSRRMWLKVQASWLGTWSLKQHYRFMNNVIIPPMARRDPSSPKDRHVRTGNKQEHSRDIQVVIQMSVCNYFPCVYEGKLSDTYTR